MKEHLYPWNAQCTPLVSSVIVKSIDFYSLETLPVCLTCAPDVLDEGLRGFSCGVGNYLAECHPSPPPNASPCDVEYWRKATYTVSSKMQPIVVSHPTCNVSRHLHEHSVQCAQCPFICSGKIDAFSVVSILDALGILPVAFDKLGTLSVVPVLDASSVFRVGSVKFDALIVASALRRLRYSQCCICSSALWLPLHGLKCAQSLSICR